MIHVHCTLYMKIHVPSMLAIGVETIKQTNTTNKEAATVAYKIHNTQPQWLNNQPPWLEVGVLLGAHASPIFGHSLIIDTVIIVDCVNKYAWCPQHQM